MTKSYTVDAHPKKGLIIKALVRGDGFKAVSAKYGVAQSCLRSYLDNRIAKQIAEARAAAIAEERDKTGKEADSGIKSRIDGVMAKLQKMIDACDEYLTDPDNPDKYDLHPRAWEFDVVYREVEPDTGKLINKKASLAWLIERLDEQGYTPWSVVMKCSDPRQLIIQTSREISKELELIAKLEGKISDQVVNITNYNQTYIDLKAIVIRATKDYPDIQRRIIEELGDA